MSIDITPAANAVLKPLKAQLTKELRVDAKRAKWPANLVKTLSISIKSSMIYVQYPNDLAEQIEDLEYGNKGQTPKPVIRFFMDRHADTVSNALVEASLNLLESKGVIP
jgi:hypothetical protein